MHCAHWASRHDDLRYLHQHALGLSRPSLHILLIDIKQPFGQTHILRLYYDFLLYSRLSTYRECAFFTSLDVGVCCGGRAICDTHDATALFCRFAAAIRAVICYVRPRGHKLYRWRMPQA